MRKKKSNKKRIGERKNGRGKKEEEIREGQKKDKKGGSVKEEEKRREGKKSDRKCALPGIKPMPGLKSS